MSKRSIAWLLVAALVALTVGGAAIAGAQDNGDSAVGQPFLGVRLAETDTGVTIVDVLPGSPAESAELQADDILEAVNGEAVTSASDVADAIAQLSPGDTVTLDVMRDEEALTLEATLGSADEFNIGRGPRGGRGMPPFGDMPFGDMPFGMMFGMNGWLGVAFEPLTTDVAAELDVEVTEGAVIREVQDESPAAAGGLQVDDIVTAVNGESVDEERTLRDRLIAYEPGDTVTLSVLRDGETLEIEVTLGEPQLPAGMDFGQGRGPWGGGRGDQSTPATPPASGVNL